MKKISPLVTVPLRYGALAGVLGAGIITALYYMGKHPLLFPPYFDFRIILFGLFMFFSLKEYRDFYKDGVLYFWEGIIMCALMVTTFTIIASLFIYFFGQYEPEFVKSFVTLYTAQVKTFPKEAIEQIGKEEFTRNLEAIKTTNSYWLARKYSFQSSIISFFPGLILSIVLRKQPKN